MGFQKHKLPATASTQTLRSQKESCCFRARQQVNANRPGDAGRPIFYTHQLVYSPYSYVCMGWPLRGRLQNATQTIHSKIARTQTPCIQQQRAVACKTTYTPYKVPNMVPINVNVGQASVFRSRVFIPSSLYGRAYSTRDSREASPRRFIVRARAGNANDTWFGVYSI